MQRFAISECECECVCTQWSAQEINSLEINWWSLKLCVHRASEPWRRDDCHVLGNIYLVFIWSNTGAYMCFPVFAARYKIGTDITTSFVKWRKRINSISKAVCALINYIEELSPTRVHRKHWHSTRWWQSEKHWTPSNFCQFESIYATDAYYFCVQIQAHIQQSKCVVAETPWRMLFTYAQDETVVCS